MRSSALRPVLAATITVTGLLALLASTVLASAAHGPTVTAALRSLSRSGAITPAVYLSDERAYVAAKKSLAHLKGVRRAELGAVMSNLQAIAAAGELTASRQPALFLTLERNRQWWTREPLLHNGARISFPPSKLVWQYYAGQGIEIQWLGTFGEANGYYLSGNQNASLRQVLNEALALATQRAGGIAWEYMFRFDGGSPPWTSGLSQGTALQVLARAWARLKEPAYLSGAQQALRLFTVAPPSGVSVNAGSGSLYAEYTYAPGDRILNGFIQALVGLYDYTAITKDPLGLRLFEAGDSQARALVPRYDTGAWSLYDQYGESNLNYHELLEEFLQHLCERTRKGPPIAPVTTTTTTSTSSTSTTTTTSTSLTTTTTGTTTSTTSTTTSSGAGSGGTSASGSAPGSAAKAIAGDQVYCTAAQHFTAYLHTAPIVELRTKTLRGGTRAGVQLYLSKISNVTITVRRGTRVVWRTGALVGAGRPRLLWPTPRAGGAFAITVTATDLAGNGATASGAITVRRATRRAHS
jgi:hypothetical protein